MARRMDRSPSWWLFVTFEVAVVVGESAGWPAIGRANSESWTLTLPRACDSRMAWVIATVARAASGGLAGSRPASIAVTRSRIAACMPATVQCGVTRWIVVTPGFVRMSS